MSAKYKKFIDIVSSLRNVFRITLRQNKQTNSHKCADNILTPKITLKYSVQVSERFLLEEAQNNEEHNLCIILRSTL